MIPGFDIGNSPELRKTMLECMKRSNRLAVNLAAVNYIDSSGIASLLEVLQDARDRWNGDVAALGDLTNRQRVDLRQRVEDVKLSLREAGLAAWSGVLTRVVRRGWDIATQHGAGAWWWLMMLTSVSGGRGRVLPVRVARHLGARRATGGGTARRLTAWESGMAVGRSWQAAPPPGDGERPILVDETSERVGGLNQQPAG